MAEEKVFQDLALQGGSAVVLRTDTSWSSTDRAIPFSISGEPLRIAMVNTDSSKGLTYNPNTGAVKAGSFVKRGGTASQFLKADGSVDSATYLKLSGGTMSGVLTLKANQYLDSYSGGLNANNSDIYNLNSIFTSDVSNDIGEGIHFYRDATHVDSMAMANGIIYFKPYRELGNASQKVFSVCFQVLHTGNFAEKFPDLNAIEILTGTSGFLRKLANNSWVLDTNEYLTAHQSVENASEEMAWGSEKKLATVGDTDITIKFPANPNTDYKVRQTNLTTNANRPLLMAYANNTTQQDQIAYKNTGILANPSTKIITANGFAINGGNNRQLLTGAGGSIQIENLEGYRRMFGDFELLCPTNEILDSINLNDWDVVRYAIGGRDIGGAGRYFVTLANHIYEGIEGKEYYIFLYNISSATCSVHIYDTFGQYEVVNVYPHHSLTIAFTKVTKENFMINYVYTPSYPYGVEEEHYNEEPTAYLPAYFTYSVEERSDVLGDFLSNFRGKNGYTLDECTSKKITLYAELMGGRHTANVQYLTEAFKSGIPYNNMEVTLYCHNGQKDAQYITYNGKGDVMPIPTGFTYKCVYTYFNGSWLITEPVLLNDVNAK